MKKAVQKQPEQSIVQQIAEVVSAFQKQSTGHVPKSATVVLSEDTLVITLHEALTPAERALAETADGAAQVQQFHRQLFATSSDALRQEIKRITGREVREAAAEVEPASGAIVHAFSTGTVVQVFQLAIDMKAENDSPDNTEHNDGESKLHKKQSGGP